MPLQDLHDARSHKFSADIVLKKLLDIGWGVHYDEIAILNFITEII